MVREGDGKLFRAEPLPTRQHPGARAPESPEQIWQRFREVLPPPPSNWQRARLDADTALRSLLDAGPPATMTPEAACRLHDLLLEAAYQPGEDPWRWRSASQRAFAQRMALFARWIVTSQGGVTAVCTADLIRLARVGGGSPPCPSAWHDPFSLGLRAALTAALPPVFDAARDAALALAGPENWAARTFFAFLLADEGLDDVLRPAAVIAEAVRQGIDPAMEPRLAPLIAEIRPSQAAAWRNGRRGYLLMDSVQAGPARLAATVMAVAAHHGEPAVPGLFWLYRQASGGDREVFALAMLETHEDDALARLAPDLHRRAVRAALNRAATLYPEWTFGRCLAVLASGRGDLPMEHRLREMIDRRGTGTVRRWAAGLDATARARLDALLELPVETLAAREHWPGVLREPPWREARGNPSSGPVLTLDPLPTPFAYRPRERLPMARVRRERALVFPSIRSLTTFMTDAAAGESRTFVFGTLPLSEPLPKDGATDSETLAWLDRRFTAIETADPRCVEGVLYTGLHDGIERQPAALALMLWERAGPRLREFLFVLEGHTFDPAPAVLERFGAAAIPGVLRLITAEPFRGLRRFGDVEAAEIAPVAAHALRVGTMEHAAALEWLGRHSDTAANALLPRAVGVSGDARHEAGHALRLLRSLSPTHREVVDAVVARYAATEPQVVEVIGEVLDHDALLDVPEVVAPLPGWFVPANLARPVLRTGGALPDDAIALVGEMLAFSTRRQVYAGLGALKRCCTVESLDAFAWDLFSAWLARGGPGQTSWAVRAVGWLGGDACARHLVPAIRRWLDMKARPQAAMGIEALADIGSDVALVELARMAETLGSKSLRGKAARHLAEAAEVRGLSADALADKIAPDLGLDARGGLDLDFGPRSFRVGFDHDLKPVVRDSAEQALKDLPRPGKADDRERATAAAAMWTTLKRDARAVAGLQTARLEAMLATSRRVAPAVFRSCFADHPLIGHLTRRLVWTQGTEAAALVFTVGEDGRAADSDGGEVVLNQGDDADWIGLAHPLRLGTASVARWRRRFDLFDLRQPFLQLDREIFTLSTAESGSPHLRRIEGVRVEAGWLRGMGTRGWPFGRPQEEGDMWWLERSVVLSDGKAGQARLYFSPGLRVGTPERDEPPRELGCLDLLGPESHGERLPIPFGKLDPVTASELIRSIFGLAGRGAHPTLAHWGRLDMTLQ